MANKERDAERATEPRDTNPSMGADDRVEQVRGTADDEADDVEEGDEDEVDEEEEDEGTF
jgi:hypothetical protein